MSTTGRLHGTYIHDFPAFHFVRAVTHDEARSLLRRSPFVTREHYDPGKAYMFLNKGFLVVEHEGDTLRALYLADGNYYVYEGNADAVLAQMGTTLVALRGTP